MSEFCTKCCEKEAQVELMSRAHFEEITALKKEIDRLNNEVEKLALDLAFYNGTLINLSCDGK